MLDFLVHFPFFGTFSEKYFSQWRNIGPFGAPWEPMGAPWGPMGSPGPYPMAGPYPCSRYPQATWLRTWQRGYERGTAKLSHLSSAFFLLSYSDQMLNSSWMEGNRGSRNGSCLSLGWQRERCHVRNHVATFVTM